MSESYAIPPSKDFLALTHPNDLWELEQMAKEVDRDDQRMRRVVAWQIDHLEEIPVEAHQQRVLNEQQMFQVAKKLAANSAELSPVIDRYVELVEHGEA